MMSRLKIWILCGMLCAGLVFSMENTGWGAQSNQSEYVVVLDYTLRNPEDTAGLDTLRPGDQALVKVHLIDPRLHTEGYGQVQARLHTKAFQPENEGTGLNGDAAIKKNGMGVTLSFPVRYLGGSDRFSFEYAYEGNLESLAKDRVEIVIAQCRTDLPPVDNDGDDGNGDSERPDESGNGNGSEYPDESGDGNSSEHPDESGNGNGSEHPDESGNGDGPLSPDDPDMGNELLGDGTGGGIGGAGVPETGSEKLIRASQFAVGDVYYGDSPILAGTDFDCSITIMATQGDENIKNAIVSLSLPTGLSFVDDTDRVYLGTLKAGRSYTADFRLRADERIRNTVCTLTVGLSGVSSYYALPLDKKETVQINVTPVERLAISNLTLPETINAAYDDGGGQFGFTLTNKGYASVTNVEISIEGDAFESGSPYVIEELKASEGVGVNLNLVTQEEGELAGSIQISYVNDFGETKVFDEPIQVVAEYRKAEINHNITVNPGIIQEPPLVPDWVWVIVTLGAVLGFVVMIRKVIRFLRSLQ